MSMNREILFLTDPLGVRRGERGEFSAENIAEGLKK